MELPGRLLNVIDVEATCWRGRPPDGQISEIIEIGVCVVDVAARERVSRQRILVRPAHSEVSEFCTELTGLTQREVDGGLSLRDACAALEDAHHSRSRPWASWGDYDRKQFELQCAAGGVRYPFGARHINAKRVFADCHGLRRPLGMAGALRHAGVPLAGRHHRGEDDAWNIGGLILQLAAGGHWPVAEGRPG